MKDSALYLEVDEDITSAIDKLTKLPEDSVRVVVPKRSTMLQSIINLKLLKKAAEDAGKKLVLVTGDRVATDLAGRVGLAVAPSLGSEAVLAEAKTPEPPAADEVIEADEPDPSKEPAEALVAAGGQSAAAAVEPVAAKSEAKRPLIFARRKLEDKPAAPSAAAAVVADPVKAGSPDAADAAASPKVPNFGQLQRRLLWIGLAVALVGGYWLAMYLFASAKVTLYAIGSKVNIDMTFAADPGLKQTDTAKGVLAGQTVTFSKDVSASFTPTGQKDVGTKASGTMTVKNEFDANAHPLQSGTRFQAPDGKMFRSTADIVVPGAVPTIQNGQLALSPGTTTVNVIADQNGDSYNEGPARYTIPGLPANQQAKIYGQGAQMSGGTSKVVTVVTQADVDKAKAEALAKDKDAGLHDLDGRVPSGYIGLSGSQKQTTSSAISTPGVDNEATTATLAVKISYTQLAVKKSEYEDLVEAKEQKQFGDNSQVYDDGLDSAELTASPPEASGRQTFQLTTEAYGGAKLDKTAIATAIKGKKYGDASDAATQYPGVRRAEISLSPAWSTRLPGRASQITVDIKVADSKDN